MAKYKQDAKELGKKLKKYIGTEVTAADLTRIYFESVKTMPWRGATRPVKISATEEVARQLGPSVLVRHIRRTGRDDSVYDDIDIEPRELTLEEKMKRLSC